MGMKKSCNMGRTIKSVNFEDIVLHRLEMTARKEGTKVSTLVNFLCRRLIFSDREYYLEKAKQSAMDLAEFRFLSERAESIIREEAL